MKLKKKKLLFKLRVTMSTITQNNQSDYKIEKLNGSNYSIWSIKFKIILIRNGLVLLIVGMELDLGITNQKTWI
jgi:hypothetical protein